MRLLIILGLCVIGCYGQQPMFTVPGSTFQRGGVNTGIPGSGQFNPNLATNTLNTGFGVGTQGFQSGTQLGVQGFQPGVQTFQTGVQGFPPGTQGFQPGVQTFQAGVQGFPPGTQGFQPGVQTFQAGGQGFPQGSQVSQPGVQSFQPGILVQQPGIQPGVPSFQPGTAGFQPGVAVNTAGMSGNVNMQNQIRTGLLGQANSAIGGFSTPFGPFGGNGLPFVFNGFRGQAPRNLVQPLPPASPIARLMMSLAQNPNNFQYATCTFNNTWNTIRGRADFRQFLIGDGRQQVNIRIQLSGLPQTAIEQERGLHVHEFGDIGDACARVGPHFNPSQTPHGSQRNFAFQRHVGDIGNIRQSTQGMVSTQYSDNVISLEGMNSIIGRSMVIKFERDDEGLVPGNSNSQVNGNTREPIGCCTVGRTNPRNWYNPLSQQDIQYMGMTGIMPEPQRTTPVTGGVNMNMNPTGTFNPNVNTNFNSFSSVNTNPNIVNTGLTSNMNTMGMNNAINPNFNTIGMNTRINPNMNTMGMSNAINPNMNTMGMPTGINPNINMGMTSGMNTNINTMGMGTGMNPNLNTMGTTSFNPQGTGFNRNLNTNPQTSPFRANPSMFGAGSFSPGVGQGQTFNFNQQGKKKRKRRATQGQ